MRRSALVLAPGLAVTLLAACSAMRGPAAPSPGRCVEGRGAADDFRTWIVELTTSADSERVEMRQALQLPQTADSSAVAFETDPRICTRGAAAMAAVQKDSAQPPSPVYLLRVGADRYIAWNYSRAGEFFEYYVFDRTFKLLEIIGT